MMTSPVVMSETPDAPRPVALVQTEDGYEVFCRLCDWHMLAMETIEGAEHLGELHVGDMHFDV